MAAIVIFLTFLMAFFFLGEDFILQDFDSVYFAMLIRATFFAAIQALASTTFAILLSFSVSFWMLGLSKKIRPGVVSFVRSFGSILFFAPTLVASMCYLKWASWFAWLPKFGWFPIVFVHVFLNILFLSYVFYTSMHDELRKNARLLEVSEVFGFSKTKFLYNIWNVELVKDVRSWSPIIFWWCFSAFNTILILGGGPKYSSPEVLLFYLIGSGDRPFRLMLLVAIQFVIGFFVYKKVKTQITKPQKQELDAEFLGRDICSVLNGSAAYKMLRLLGSLLLFTSLFFWIPALGGFAKALNFEFFDFDAAARSFSVLWRAVVLAVVVMIFGFRFTRKLMSAGSFSLFVSPLALVALLSPTAFFQGLEVDFKYWLASALCFWTTFPVLSNWVLHKKKNLSERTRDLTTVYGAGFVYRARYVYFPNLLKPILGYFQILVVAVVSDIAISSLVLGSVEPTFAQKIYSNVVSYRFDVAFVLFGYLLLLILPLWFGSSLLEDRQDVT